MAKTLKMDELSLFLSAIRKFQIKLRKKILDLKSLLLSQFKLDYSAVKSKSEVHIIRSHREKKKSYKNFQNGHFKKFFLTGITLT